MYVMYDVPSKLYMYVIHVCHESTLYVIHVCHVCECLYVCMYVLVCICCMSCMYSYKVVS